VLSLWLIFYDGIIFYYWLKGHCTKGQVCNTFEERQGYLS